jgi:hypothetical protein
MPIKIEDDLMRLEVRQDHPGDGEEAGGRLVGGQLLAAVLWSQPGDHCPDHH